MRRTKIVCTIGPSSNSRAVLTSILRAGMDVSRLNFSHGTHEEHARVIGLLRELSKRMGRPLAILQDLSGPKVRFGTFATPSITLKRGQEVLLVPADHIETAPTAGDPCPVLPLPVPELLAALRPNNTLLLDDGKMMLRVLHCEGEPGSPDRCIRARCSTGGELKPRKGVTAPGVAFSLPAVTAKDRADLRFGLAQGVDWVAASYVRNAADLEPLRLIMDEVGVHVPLIAKIEKWEAVHDLDSILAAVDGIMVARGDLGVEMPFDEVPVVQKRIIRACNRVGKPVITATQMLESMMQNPRPTRAEATDVFNAILDGTDAVMLSGETAAGQYPVEAVRTMAKIAARAEDSFFKTPGFDSRLDAPSEVTDAVARAAAEIADRLHARAILCATSTGSTARKVAQYRSKVPILGAATTWPAYHRLALTWGVLPCYIGPVKDTDSMMLTTIEAALRLKMIHHGDRVVLTAGLPVNSPGTTNLIKVYTVGQPLSPSEP
jgi:pyruvate kinase